MTVGLSELVLILLAIILSSIHLNSKTLSKIIEDDFMHWLSFAAASLLATVFLIFLPHVVEGDPDHVIYPLMLAGFAVFFLSEKYLYQHVKDEKTLEEDLYHLHIFGFFIDHSIKGFILVTIVGLRPVVGFLTFIPFFIHTVASTIALESFHKISGSDLDRYVLSSSVLIGVLSGIFLDIGEDIERGILAFTLGILMFLVSRDILPKEGEGRPRYFILGMATIFTLWLMLEFLLL